MNKKFRELVSYKKGKISAKRKHKQNRRLVLKYYSDNKLICACCGEDIYDFLTIDHINNDGNKHRKEIHTLTLYKWLIKNGFPDGFQVLCMNCNLGRSKYEGICPHRRIN